MLKLRLLFFALILSFSQVLWAQNIQRPDVMLDSITQEMISVLKANELAIKRDPNILVVLIYKILVPHVDAHDMSRWVVGRNAWINASKSQRSRFTDAFQELLVRTYATTLNAYSNQVIEYSPVKGDYKNKKRIQVSSSIREPGRPPINVKYRLVQKKNNWKVYDIIIEGVSLLQGFQSQFSTDISRFGIESVIKKISIQNKKPLS